MRTLDLGRETVTVDDLLRWASVDTVLIRQQNGQEFILEEAHDFDREVAELAASERFMAFLEERAREPGSISLEELEASLEQEEAPAEP